MGPRLCENFFKLGNKPWPSRMFPIRRRLRTLNFLRQNLKYSKKVPFTVPPRVKFSSKIEIKSVPRLSREGNQTIPCFNKQRIEQLKAINRLRVDKLPGDACISKRAELLPRVPSNATTREHPMEQTKPADKSEECSEGKRVSFEDLGVCEELCLACDKLGWKSPTVIQQKCIPVALAGSDIIGLAETGSGKTGAFSIPIIQKLLDRSMFERGIFALVLAPTRELALQISEAFLALGSIISLRVCAILGGVDMVTQAMALLKKPHIIVATPGRVHDHLQHTKGFILSSIKYLVMDEADKLLALDFEDIINKIFEVIPTNRHTFLFSATMTDRVAKLQRASLRSPVKIEVNSKYDTVGKLSQFMKLIPPQYKYTYLIAFLNYMKAYKTMIFCNTCLDTRKVDCLLGKLGFSSVCLHGKMSQPQRFHALNIFKSQQKQILVATEVGSRGLDIPQIEIVLNFHVPLSAKDYIHRVGRTARAGRSGRSLTFVTPYDVEAFQQIELATKKKMEPFEEIAEESWRSLHETVEEIKILAEKEVTNEFQSKQRSSGAKNRKWNR